MNEIIEKEDIIIEDMIYEVRGIQVMLDSDLARLYHVETKRVNEAVKNNPKKFPDRFSFVLSDEDKEILWSKFSTANISTMSRSNPRVFTEQGVYMLATILKPFKKTYTCGSSFKDLGKKCFVINELSKSFIDFILKEII